MKKVVWIFFFLLPLLLCQDGNYWAPSMSSFEFSRRCPHGCWLGINPGVTTEEQAEGVLSRSHEIVGQIIHFTDQGISVCWGIYEDCDQVDLKVDQGIVNSITFDVWGNFTLGDFVALLGRPDEVKIDSFRPPDCVPIMIYYLVTYRSRRISLDIANGDWSGPQPRDEIYSFGLNVNDNSFDIFLSDHVVHNQPWLGYGHIKKYLPGIVVPDESTYSPQPCP